MQHQDLNDHGVYMTDVAGLYESWANEDDEGKEQLRNDLFYAIDHAKKTMNSAARSLEAIEELVDFDEYAYDY